MRGKLSALLIASLFLFSSAFALLSNEALCKSQGYTWINGSDYPATYSFTNDAVGSNPAGWISEGSNTVLGSIGGHNKVIYQATGTTHITNEFTKQAGTGTIEFWLRHGQNNQDHSGSPYITDSNGGGIIINIRNNGQYSWYNGAHQDFMAYSSNTWYHWRIDFNYATKTYNIIINGERKVTGATMYTWSSFTDGLKQLRMHGYYTAYFDAVSYSWDSSFIVGDNLMGGCCGDDLIDLRSGLVSEWHFDEGAGSAAYDSIGSTDGALSGTSFWTNNGKYGSAFSGSTDDYVDIDNNLVNGLGAVISVSAWIKSNNISRNEGILYIGTGLGAIGEFEIAKNTGEIFVRIDRNGVYVATGSLSGYEGNWLHVTGTYDGTNVKLYFNGELVDSYAHSVSLSFTGDDPIIGSYYTKGSFNFNGDIDEVRVYNRALSDREVAYLYNTSAYKYYNFADSFTSDFHGTCENNDYFNSLDNSYYGCDSKGFDYFTSDDWALTGWNQRKNFTITEASGSDLANYQVAVNPNTYNTSGLIASYHFNSEEQSVVKDYSGYNNYGALNGSTVGLWHFDENTGTTAYDSTVNSRNGVITGATWNSTSISGTALYFDGDEDYVNTGISTTLQKFTVTAWVKPLSTAGDIMEVIGKRSYYVTAITDFPFALYLNAAGTQATVFVDSGNDFNFDLSTSTGTFTNNVWHQLVASYDGSVLKIYLDGNLSNSASGSVTLSSNARNYFIGRASYEDHNTDYKGVIDEAAIYDKAFSADEVKSLYYSQKAQFVEYKSGYEDKGTGLSFDGVNDYVTLPNIHGHTAYTQVAWVKWGGGTGYHYILETDDGTVSINAASNCFYYFSWDSREGGTGIIRTKNCGSGTITPNVWTQVAVVASGTTVLNLYINGKLAENTFGTDDPSGTYYGDYIGAWEGAGSFNGTIDEVRVYNRALPASEVSELYQETKGRFDYADLRFYNATGEELSYYNEFDNKTWVKIPYLAASTSQNITMYYDNEGANSRSNGDTTFDFFDDFNGDSLDTSKWGVHNSAHGNIYLRGGEVTISNTAGSTGVGFGIHSNANNTVIGEVLEVRSKNTAGKHSDVIAYGGSPYTPYVIDANMNGLGWYSRADIVTSDAHISVGSNYESASGLPQDLRSYHSYKVELASTSSIKMYMDNILRYTFTQSNAIPNMPLQIMISADGNTKPNTVVYDYVRLRKYASTEPAITEHANESAFNIGTGLVAYYSFDNDAENKTIDSVGKYTGTLYGDTIVLWHFDEGSGTIAFDKTSYSKHGTLTNSPVWVSGISGYGVQTTGTQYISTNINLDNDWTMSVWFYYPLPAGSYQTLARGTQNHVVIVSSNTHLGVYCNEVASCGTAGFQDSGYDVTSLSTGWHYLVAVGNTGLDTDFYIDGVYVGDSPAKSSEDILAVGNYQGGGQPFGKIDEFAIYDKILTPEEISELYESKHAQFTEHVQGENVKGLKFDGVNDYIAVNSVNNFKFNTPFSVAFWIKSSKWEQTILDTRPDGNNGWLIADSWFQINGPSLTYQRIIQGNDNYNDNNWHHMVYTWDGTYASGSMKAYLDGADNTASFSYGKTSSSAGTTISALWISDSITSDFPNFNGTLDEVRVYNRALTHAEIIVLYNATRAEFGCCGDDYYADNFYNGTLGSTSYFCHNGGFVNEEIDDNAGLCAYYNNNWIEAASNDWHNATFAYRKPIIVNENSYNNLYDYEINITLDTATLVTASKMQADCDDIRFYTTNGTKLNYWIESGCNTASTSVWVKVQFIPYNASITFYAYYGNSTVNSESNGSAVFHFFDDFETYNDGDLNGQGGWSANAAFDVVTDQAKTGSKSIRLNIETNAYKTFTNISNVIIQGYMWGNLQRRAAYGIDEGSTNKLQTFFGAGNNIYYAASSGLADTNTNYVSNTWHKIEQRVLSTSHNLKVFIDNVEYVSAGTAASYNNLNTVHLWMGYDAGSEYARWDQLIVRNYAYPMPSVSFGNEVPFTSANRTYASCCGDDLINDNFYNATNAFGSVCYSGNYYFTALDRSETNCKSAGLDWISTPNYPGTYSFTDDNVGEFPSGWLNSLAADVTGVVSSEYEGHSKVFKITDLNAAGGGNVRNTISEHPTNGTIEFWALPSNNTQVTRIRIDNSSTYNFYVKFNSDGTLEYQNRAGLWVDIMPYSANTWYHIRIDFECGDGLYLGLLSDTFYVTINGILYGPYEYRFYSDYFNRLVFEFGNAENGYDFCLDAVGYSWDADYDLGDNSVASCCGDDNADDYFYNSTNAFGSICYYGNFHSIALDQSQTNCESEGLIWLANTDYLGTYSFTDDAVGGDPSGWTDTSGTGCTANIISGLDGHNKVYELVDNGAGAIIVSQTFPSVQVSGIVEMWVRVAATNKYFNVRLNPATESGGSAGMVAFSNDGKIYWYGSGTLLRSYTANNWYHIRIDFECSSGGYEGLGADQVYVYINGIKYGPYNFAVVKDSINAVELRTDSGTVGPTAYFDAVGYSWDTTYDIGDDTWGACCGDDSTSDSFFNSTTSCYGGVPNYCGVEDGVCPETYYPSMGCTPPDPDCASTDPDVNINYCANASTTWEWFSNYKTGNTQYCCGNNGEEDNWLSTTSCCYNGDNMTNGFINNSLFCLNGNLYDCNNQVSDAVIDTNVNTGEIRGILICATNNSWIEGGYGASELETTVLNSVLFSGQSYIGAVKFKIYNPSSAPQVYKFDLTYDRGYAHFTNTKTKNMQAIVQGFENSTNYIDIYPVISGTMTLTLTMTNLNNPDEVTINQFSVNIVANPPSNKIFDVYSLDEVTIFEILVNFLNKILVK